MHAKSSQGSTLVDSDSEEEEDVDKLINEEMEDDGEV